MARNLHKQLSFPFSGVVRRAGYFQQTRPYSTPFSVNMRGYDAIESRLRGGSRPGLILVEDVEESAVGTWQWPNGEAIEWENDSEMTYDYLQSSIVAPDGSRIVDPHALLTISANKGEAPSGYTMSCIYRDRVFVGKGPLWYASRVGDYSDWDFGGDMSDSARAVVGSVALAGVEASDLTAMIPFRDKYMILATANSLHLLEGDPAATGSIRVVSEDIGIIAASAWAFDGELFCFLSNDGVYVGPVGSRPQRFSEVYVPDELRNIDVDSNQITMVYDAVGRGFHLFITPVTGTGKHYFFDMVNKAIWPVAFGDDGLQPVVAARIKSKTLERVVLKCRDNQWREFSNSAWYDEGPEGDNGPEAIEIVSHLAIGPIRMTTNDLSQSLLSEIHGTLGIEATASYVACRVYSGNDPESVVDRCIDAVSPGEWHSNGVVCDFSCTFDSGRNNAWRPRLRGCWFVLLVSSGFQWAFESITVKSIEKGNVRL